MIYTDKIELDNGLFFGKGLFETILVKEKPVFLKEHIERINNASKTLDIKRNIDYKEVLNFIEKNNIKNKAFKITLTDENVIYSTRNISYAKDNYEKGFSLYLSKVLRNSTSKLTFVKSTCYIENIMEKALAKDLGYDEPIFLNEKGFLAEGATSNIFFIKDNKILTPKVEVGLLDGIIRQWVIRNFKVEEGEYTLDDLISSKGIFITNSLLGIMKVCEFKGKKFNNHDKIEEVINAYKKSIN